MRIYQCNVCNGPFQGWPKGACHIERPVGQYPSYVGEESFIICSEECRQDPSKREKFITWLSSKEGWTKKTATENYDQCIAGRDPIED